MVFTSTLPPGCRHPLCSTYSIHRPHPERGEVKKSDNQSLCQLKILHSNLMRRKAVLGNVLIAVSIYHDTVGAVLACTTDLAGRRADLSGGGLSLVVVAEVDTVYSSWTLRKVICFGY